MISGSGEYQWCIMIENTVNNEVIGQVETNCIGCCGYSEIAGKFSLYIPDRRVYCPFTAIMLDAEISRSKGLGQPTEIVALQ